MVGYLSQAFYFREFDEDEYIDNEIIMLYIENVIDVYNKIKKYVSD